ncbi:hypothetical protein SAMN05519103_04051 [Rhizobiales bacterium GAS113]|nr:hypothetical protein SAMN05519103_04051 [Rhizobiales bacterium GAS113]
MSDQSGRAYPSSAKRSERGRVDARPLPSGRVGDFFVYEPHPSLATPSLSVQDLTPPLLRI